MGVGLGIGVATAPVLGDVAILADAEAEADSEASWIGFAVQPISAELRSRATSQRLSIALT